MILSAFKSDFLQKFFIDKAILWNLIGFGISALSGPIAAFLIASRFSPELQGYYYTFASLLALSVFLELGFGTCIVQFASHEFAHLNWVRPAVLHGPMLHLHRFISLARLSLKWYIIAAFLLLIGVGMAGEIFFQRHDSLDIAWRGGWWLLCISTAGGLPLLAAMSLLTGCNEIAWTAQARILQNLVRTMALIISLLSGIGLYAPGVAAGVGTITLFFLLCFRWWPLFKQSLQAIPKVDQLSWKQEIWPFQWRIAISWVSGYLIFSTFNPILFEYEGAVVAGQFGITWAILQACGGVAQVFTNTRQPTFGILLAQKKWFELRHIWMVSLKQTVIVFLLIMGVFISAFFAINFWKPEIGARFLNWDALLPLILATLINQVIFSIATLARAEKKEPFLGISVCWGLLVLMGGIIFCNTFGINGIMWNYFVVTLGIFPWTIRLLFKTKAFSLKT
jgi:hypothetical protein